MKTLFDLKPIKLMTFFTYAFGKQVFGFFYGFPA